MSPRLVVLLAVVAASLSVAAVGQDLKSCSTTGNYTDGSQYEQNLESLLSTLSAPAAANGNDGWFDSDSVGTAPDRAWGLIMCYADRTATQCLDCLRNASLGWLSEVCPGHSRGLSVSYGDGCLLRYADAPFFGTADTGGDWLFVWATAYVNVTADAARMNETRWRLLSDLAERAAGDDGGALRLMMSGAARYTDARGEEQVLYGFVQCTRDLEASECTRCLALALTVLSEHKDLNSSLAGSVKGFSCYVRYQLNDPIQVAVNPPQPAEAAPPLRSEGRNTVLILVLGVVVAVFVAGARY